MFHIYKYQSINDLIIGNRAILEDAPHFDLQHQLYSPDTIVKIWQLAIIPFQYFSYSPYNLHYIQVAKGKLNNNNLKNVELRL